MKENYGVDTRPLPQQQLSHQQQAYNLPPPDELRSYQPEAYRFCLDETPMTFDENYHSLNQQLVGPPNPKTLKAGVLLGRDPAINPIYAFDYWGDNGMVPSYINSEVQTELVQSGYMEVEPTCASACGVGYNGQCIQKEPNTGATVPLYKPEPVDVEACDECDVKEYYSSQYPTPNEPRHYYPGTVSKTPTRGDILDDVYYNQDNLNYNLPTNYPTGECYKQDQMKEYNKQLFTTPLEPGISVQTQVIDPIQSNIGISYNQQFQPVTYADDAQGNRQYTIHDPRKAPHIAPKERPEEVTESNVYDPRHYGYGTSYRTYIDPLTGRPKFYYDDIDSIRRPNFIARTNVDHIPNAIKYGPMDETHLKHNLLDTRKIVHKDFLDNTLQLREELQERAMKKYNTEIAWQRRQAPLHPVFSGSKC